MKALRLNCRNREFFFQIAVIFSHKTPNYLVTHSPGIYVFIAKILQNLQNNKMCHFCGWGFKHALCILFAVKLRINTKMVPDECLIQKLPIHTSNSEGKDNLPELRNGFYLHFCNSFSFIYENKRYFLWIKHRSIVLDNCSIICAISG